MRNFTVIMLAVLGMPAMAISHAHATGCDSGQGVRISGSTVLMLHDPYNPFSAFDLTETKTLTVSNLSQSACLIALAFVRTPPAGELHSGTQSLSYALEDLKSGQVLFTSIGTIPSPAELSSPGVLRFQLSPGQSISFGVRVRLPRGQMAGPGTYTDDSAEIRVYLISSTGTGTLLDARALTTSAQVAAICVLPPPTQSTLDFTSSIGSDARPREDWKTTTFSGAECNAPARLSLLGDALRPAQQPTSTPGLDTFINFQAEAHIETIAAILITDKDEGEETGVSAVQTSSPFLSADLDLRVKLIAGRPVAAGSYSSVLTVRIEPAP